MQNFLDTELSTASQCDIMLKTVSEAMGVRFTPEDRKLLVALSQKTGISSVSEILRMALRALAAKEGVAA